MTTQHTPGPWSVDVEDYGHSNTGGPYVAVVDELEKSLAHVLCSDYCGRSGDLPYAANARLIAAAPDMLGALEGMCAAYRSLCLMTGQDFTEHRASRYQAALIAIAKAKGEAQ